MAQNRKENKGGKLRGNPNGDKVVKHGRDENKVLILYDQIRIIEKIQ